jgi:hypothetical protein
MAELEATEVLAKAIGELARNADRRAALAAEATAGSDRFDVPRRIGEVVSLYREVLSKAR